MAKLTRKQLSAIDSKEYTRKQISVICGGKTYDFEVDVKFRQSKIQEMIKEALTLQDYSNKLNVGDFNLHGVVIAEVVKTFTDAPYLESGNIQEILLDILVTTRKLTDMTIDSGGCVFQTLVEAIDPLELQKVKEVINTVGGNIQVLEKMIEETKIEEEEENVGEPIEQEIL